jgi:acetyl esterase/lipase
MVDHLIVLPGSGYFRLAPHEGEPVAAWLRDLGHDASVFDYPVQVPYPATDLAIRAEIRARRAAGADRVGILGFSAGGHAGGLVAFDADGAERVDLAILCYPVVSMLLDTHQGSREHLIGLDATAELRAATSLETRVTASAPPTFLWHTGEDVSVPVAHSYLLADALGAAGVPYELHVFPRGRHGLGLAEGVGTTASWTTLCAAWLTEVGWH